MDIIKISNNLPLLRNFTEKTSHSCCSFIEQLFTSDLIDLISD